jgi:folate-binding protein YgfZ
MSDIAGDYDALTAGAGLVELSNRTQVEVVGDDRAKFLHNMCTNDIRRLESGKGCEAFFLNAKGHILGFGYVFAGPRSHVIETVPEQGKSLIAHMDRFIIREKVGLHDRSQTWGELLLAGAKAPDVLRALVGEAVPAEPLSHVAADISGRPVWVRRVAMTLPGGYLIACSREDAEAVNRSIADAGAVPCNDKALEPLRIEAGTPAYGADISDKNLPQELDRDSRAISFVKGCYIGQETVARLDALGHVNKLLVGLRIQSNDVAAGLDVVKDGQTVGTVTSAAWSPRLQATVALGYVRRGSHMPGTVLSSAAGEASVVTLPMQ